jgi:hypothetical protein
MMCGCDVSACLDRAFEPHVGLAIGCLGFSSESGADLASQVPLFGVLPQHRGLAAPQVITGETGKSCGSRVDHD